MKFFFPVNHFIEALSHQPCRLIMFIELVLKIVVACSDSCFWQYSLVYRNLLVSCATFFAPLFAVFCVILRLPFFFAVAPAYRFYCDRFCQAGLIERNMNSIDFKDEAAVKDYIDRLGVEYRFQCFGEGRTDGCHRLGDWLEFSMKDWVKAGRVYKSNCLLHDYGHSCGKFANYAFLGRGTERKVDEAAEFYRKGCYSAEHPYAPVRWIACYCLWLICMTS